MKILHLGSHGDLLAFHLYLEFVKHLSEFLYKFVFTVYEDIFFTPSLFRHLQL